MSDKLGMKVLFVCSGNAHRSPLAEALLKEMRPEWNVDSAGLMVAIPISEQLKIYLGKEKAARYLKKSPESFESKRLSEYDLIVAMEQRHKNAILTRCPECINKIIVWSIEDPYFLQERAAENIYDNIKRKVTELANQGT